MTADVLSQYFSPASGEQQRQLFSLFEKLETFESLFYALIAEENGKYKFGYASRSIAPLTGYPAEKFSYHGGSPFFYSITPPSYRELVLEQEVYYLKKARRAEFDITKPFILEIEGAIQHQDGRILSVRMISVVFKLTNQRTPKLGINTWQFIDKLTEGQLLTSRLEVELVLRNLHKVYSQIFSTCEPEKGGRPTDMMRLSYPLYDCDVPTMQEYRVLKLLANGFSTERISSELHISVNTTETHRRHLLQKFKAVNVAEMIKKATKLYWLE